MPSKKKNVALPIQVDGAAPAPPMTSRKKQFPVVAIVTPEGIDGKFSPEPCRPLIAHLPIRSSEVVFYDQPLVYDPTPPPSEIMCYEAGDDNYESVTSDAMKELNHYEAPVKEEVQAPVKEITGSATVYQKNELLVQMKGTHTTHTLPEKVDVACQWCCHTFEGVPSIIPIREENGIWEVYGCFCCPECALAYLIDEKEDSHVRWERISLLHTLYNNGANTRIYPAPSRNTLSMFGGQLGIDAYRKTMRDKKIRIDVQMPPMVSILATMDTKPIDFYETSVQKSFVPMNIERVQRAEEGLRLKRSKPLKDRDSTLDSCINLQIRKVTPISFDFGTGE